MPSGVGKYKDAFRLHLFKKQDGLCFYGDGPMSFNRKKSGQPARDFATFEHLKRRQQGGQMSGTNIVLAHYKCNIRRNAEWQAQQGNANVVQAMQDREAAG